MTAADTPDPRPVCDHHITLGFIEPVPGCGVCDALARPVSPPSELTAEWDALAEWMRLRGIDNDDRLAIADYVGERFVPARAAPQADAGTLREAAERVVDWADHHEPWNPDGTFAALYTALGRRPPEGDEPVGPRYYALAASSPWPAQSNRRRPPVTAGRRSRWSASSSPSRRAGMRCAMPDPERDREVLARMELLLTTGRWPTGRKLTSFEREVVRRNIEHERCSQEVLGLAL
jgi:hypothetical protein